jgi:disulfide bond formation protein DsbB
MLEKTNNIIFIFILCIITASLIGAFIIEYVLGYQPCKLCIYERVPYFVSIFLILEIIFLKKNIKFTLLLISITFLVSSILAFYHFGIEQGFIIESFMCENEKVSEIITKEELLDQLKSNSISCKDVSFTFFGFSLAAINTILSLLLSVIFIRLFLNYGKN